MWLRPPAGGRGASPWCACPAPGLFRGGPGVFSMGPGQKVENARGYTALFGHFQARGRTLDEGVALFFRAPAAIPARTWWSSPATGARSSPKPLIEACIAAGAAPAGPGEYTKRAFLNGRISLTQAEAVMDVISAAGRQGAALAEHALGGALAKTDRGLQGNPAGPGRASGRLGRFSRGGCARAGARSPAKGPGEVLAGVSALVESYGAGAVLRQGSIQPSWAAPTWANPPFLNLLAGFDRAIVTPWRAPPATWWSRPSCWAGCA